MDENIKPLYSTTCTYGMPFLMYRLLLLMIVLIMNVVQCYLFIIIVVDGKLFILLVDTF